MTDVETVSKAKLDIVENENHITSIGKNAEEQLEVKNRVAEREQNENLEDKTPLNEEKRNDWAEARPPPKNPWTRHFKANGEKGKRAKLLSYLISSETAVSKLFCVFFFQKKQKNPLL